MARPVLDRLDTRALERREVVRTFVKQASVREVGERSIVLDNVVRATHGMTRGREVLGSGASNLPADGDVLAGTLRVDIVGDGVIRVRYAEGGDVPTNDTPMVVGAPAPPRRCEIAERENAVEARTGTATLVVTLKPLTITFGDAEIGGLERNAFRRWDAFNTGISRTLDGRPLATEIFRLGPQEAVFGFGERFGKLNTVGQTIDVNHQEATGTTTPRGYKNVPFFWTTKGYGAFVNQTARMTTWVGSLSATDIQIAVEDDFLDHYVILGEPKEILARYTELTGAGELPPKWSFGFWQSKISYASAEEALDVVRSSREAGVPMDVLHLDTHWFNQDWFCDLTFDAERFPDPAAFMSELDALGVKVSLWQLPYIPEGCALFDDLAAVDGFVKTADGDLYDIGICYTRGFSGRVGCIDLTNPRAREVYTGYLRRLFDLGAKVIKVDFGEEAPLDGVWTDGTPSHRMHNLYPLLYAQTVYEATREATGEPIIWCRSATAGSQRYPVHWGGDSTSNWANVVPQFRGGLSLGASGFAFWSQDIGGFLGPTGGELLVRWMQAGMFTSHCRIHGSGERELYRFDEPVLRHCRDAIRLRYTLLPYLYGQAQRCVERSLPFARPLAIEYPNDPTTWDIDDQWLCGDHLMVAPVYDATGVRAVYVPAGAWRDWWTGERIDGPAWFESASPLDRIPLLVREGGIVALGPEMDHVGAVPTEEITLRIVPFDGDGVTTCPVATDDGIIEVSYVARDGSHEVRVPRGGPRFAVDEAFGADVLSIERVP